MNVSINRHTPERWNADTLASVELYNEWFLQAAPDAYRKARATVVTDVAALFAATNNLDTVTPQVLRSNPALLSTLRMSTAPPIARDRLAGLASVPPNVISRLEAGALPSKVAPTVLDAQLQSICDVLVRLLDRTLFGWLDGAAGSADKYELALAEVVVSDRKCLALANPILRNEQERRQLAPLSQWLNKRGYVAQQLNSGEPLEAMKAGTYTVRQNVSVVADNGSSVSMPIDLIVQPIGAKVPSLPILVEAKSAGDFTNTNKRRKEEATKMRQLRNTFGPDVTFILFLSGYFDATYLGYEAAEGIDWVWEHRTEDFALAGV